MIMDFSSFVVVCLCVCVVVVSRVRENRYILRLRSHCGIVIRGWGNPTSTRTHLNTAPHNCATFDSVSDPELGLVYPTSMGVCVCVGPHLCVIFVCLRVCVCVYVLVIYM